MFQYVELFSGRLGRLEEAAICLRELTGVKTLHGGPDPVPGETGLPLDDPDEEKRQKASAERLSSLVERMAAYEIGMSGI